MKYGVQVEVDEWYTTVCRMTRSKVKITEVRNVRQSLSPTPICM